MNSKELIKKFRYYDNKINLLWSKRQRIEALLFMSLLVELFVKEIIFLFEKIIEGVAVKNHVNFNPKNLYSRDDIKNQPLGYLIRILNTYTKDKVLIQMLKSFLKMRNKCVHQLLENEIKDINKELKGFNIFYYKLIIKLLKLNTKQTKMIKKSFVCMCDDCFKKILPKQIKL